MLLNKKSSSEIRLNFIKTKSFDNSSISKALDWFLSIGKGIFIFAFFIIILTFYQRYQLDRKLDVLKSQTDSAINDLESMKSDEKKIVSFQNQIDTVAEITQDRIDNEALLNTLQSTLPVNLHLTKLSVKKGEISFSGEANNEAVLADFLKALKEEEKFTQINIDSINSGGVQNPVVKFAIKLTFSPTVDQNLKTTNPNK